MKPKTSFMLEMAKRSVGVAAACLPLLVLSADAADAATEQNIRDAILERKTFSAQRLGELDLNRDGRVDVADAALNQIAEGILPKAGVWAVILTPEANTAGGTTQFTMTLAYDPAGNRTGSVTNQGSGFLSQGGTVLLPPAANTPISFKAEVKDNTVLPASLTAMALPFAHSITFWSEPGINPFIGTDIITGRYEEVLAPSPATPQTAHLTTRVYGTFLM